jgi:hypothetical protein
MNYQKIHDQIINRVKLENRKKGTSVYYERHHIIPKCIGGTNDKENLVLLTAREHFIIHKLLCEIYPDNNKLFLAYRMMAIMKSTDHIREYKISSREFARIRLQSINLIQQSISKNPDWGKWNSGKVRSNEYKQHLSNINKGNRPSLESRKKNSDAHKGEQNHFFGKTHTLESKKKMSEAKKGKPGNRTGAVISLETRKKISESVKRTNQLKREIQNGK